MYKTILTCLTSSKSAETLSEVGAYVAEKFGAHLIGAHNSRHILPADEGEPETRAEHREHPLEQAEAIQQIFEKVAMSRRLSFEWRHKELPEPQGLTDIVSQALTVDLIVAGGRDAAGTLGNWYDLPVRLAMEAARPVMLVPANGKYTSIGKHITVAWNRSRESARAVFEALPLLKAAESVRLLAINAAASGALGSGDCLPQTLTRHDVKVKTIAVEGVTSPAETLTADIADSHTDLLVMGCFGRPRLLEMVLGGVTRHVLGNVNVPVLLAH